MATSCCCCLKFGVVYLVFYTCIVFSSSEDSEKARDESGQSGTIHFNNPKLLSGLNSHLFRGDGFYYDIHSQEALDAKQFGGIIIQMQANRLAARLRKISDEEMGVAAMQAIMGTLLHRKHTPNVKRQLRQVVDQLQGKIDRYLSLLKTTKMRAEYLYVSHLREPIHYPNDCCSVPNSQLRYDKNYHCGVSTHLTCDLSPSVVSGSTFMPGRNLTEVFQHNRELIPVRRSIKWQYFISEQGVQTVFPALNFHCATSDCSSMNDVLHRDVYVKTIHPQRKHVLIMIDHGNSLSSNQLRTGKAVARQILLSLSENDRVGVIGLAGKVSYPRNDDCLSQKMAPLTHEARLFFQKFVDGLQKDGYATAHPLGFEKAFQMVWNSIHNSSDFGADDKVIIAYISRGLLSALTEAQEVLVVIANQNARLDNRVIINTYAIIDDGKPIMYEKKFLQDVAEQNFDRYDVRFAVDKKVNKPVKKGKMVAVNSTEDLSVTVGKFYQVLELPISDEPHFSLPTKDSTGKGLVMSLTWACIWKGQLVGVVGMDVDMSDIMEGVTYFSHPAITEAFVIDPTGYTLMHHKLSRPMFTYMQPMHTDISHFEDEPGFARIRQRLLSEPVGEESLLVYRNSSATSSNESPAQQQVFVAKYLWKKVSNAPYIVVIKVKEEVPSYKELKGVEAGAPSDMVYHRLDLLPTEHMCMHMKQLATLDTSTLFLSTSSFKLPYEHLSQEETKRLVQRYMTYLYDNTNLIVNTGLKDDVKNEVAALSKINSLWYKQAKHGHLNDYIIRRYAASANGVFRVFPGTLMDKAYDPLSRQWFRRAMEYPGKVTVTAPYLDVGGAGYIVTVSHTIFEENDSNQVTAVLGLDVTLGYFYKLLLEVLPVCDQDNIRCFMMDDRGYLIAHRGLVEPNGRGPIEQQHITHKEPLVANDILSHQGFVKKSLCNSYVDRTIQRFYNFNVSFSGVLTNLVHGEHCAKYQITSLPGTNVFLGVVNHTCTMMTAFCPCSMVDRLCLNCHRMEQTECECPCECPLDMDFCTGQLLDEQDNNPGCPRYEEPVGLGQVSEDAVKNLPQCTKPRCSERKSRMDCFGVIDCEWCQLEHDGVTPLSTPFCANQRVCFAGVMGGSTPYHDEIKVALQLEEPVTFKSTPVGPVAGGIMGCFLVLALGVYCYRHQVHRNTHQYISTAQDTQMRMSQLDNETDDIDPTEDLGSGHTNVVLATFDNPASISPYRVNTSYRRPTGGDSDHGYSTMTPHDDSEQASMSCIEPLVIAKDRYRPSPNSTAATILKNLSILPPPPNSSRRSQSPTPPQTRLPSNTPPHTAIPEQTHVPGQTTLGSDFNERLLPSNSILASVQVHMVDTH